MKGKVGRRGAFELLVNGQMVQLKNTLCHTQYDDDDGGGGG